MGRRLAVLRERIAGAGGDPERVRIVAVTKGFGVEAARVALALGLVDLGENYAQELLAKAAGLAAGVDQGGPRPRWHFIGRLQGNKVKGLAPFVALWQTVDRPSLVTELARRAPGSAVLVQVNVSGEPRKGGCAPDDAPGLVAALRDQGLAVRGLMAVGRTGPPELARPGFAALAALADRLGLPERSMGMSADLEAAVCEGATIIRVGEALFGPRPAAAVARH
ncbi:MAG: YggS family pyridoxal phosphate enzyme [Acidimicrobiales bacterium]|nr:YggS family pyridoxal phosphate enzyme [Acidimicrobiales bacterium]